MQATGYTVGSATEFSAGMKNRMDHFNSRDAHFGMDTDRNAAAIVTDGHRTIRIDVHVDRITASCQSLVDGIGDNFINQMM